MCVCRGVFLLSSFTGFVGCVQENSTVLFYLFYIVLLHWICWLCAGEQHGVILFYIVHLNWVCWLCAGEQHRGVCFYCPPSLGLLAMCRRTARCYFIYFLLSILTGFVDCVQVNSTVLFYLLFIVHLNLVCWLCAGEQHGSVGFYCPPSLGLLAVCRRTAPWCVSIVLLHWVCWLCAGEQHRGVFEPEQEQAGDPRGPTHRRCPE